MQTYFADTWYFIALHDRFDDHHVRARRLEQLLSGAAVLTHDGVLTEMLAHFSDDGPFSRMRAAALTRQLLSSLEVIAADRSLFLSALTRYEQRPDKEYSLVDCMSMVLMTQRGITHVLTNDHHFRQEGFTVLSDAQ